ncbi:MAG: endonuclease [Leptospira sp.]|nr:endonuclease [Leptospira sp.]
MRPRKNTERSQRIEWEHVVSAHAFGNTLPCWRQKLCSRKGRSFKGRKCCIREDATFSMMEADLHNLRPVPGELNGDRSNFHFGILPEKANQYGSCHFKVNFTLRLAEPDPSIRGDIARTYFYMEKTYGVRISSKNRRLYEIWNKQDPPDEWEIERNLRIKKIQGNDNPFISRYEEFL